MDVVELARRRPKAVVGGAIAVVLVGGAIAAPGIMAAQARQNALAAAQDRLSRCGLGRSVVDVSGAHVISGSADGATLIAFPWQGEPSGQAPYVVSVTHDPSDGWVINSEMGNDTSDCFGSDTAFRKMLAQEAPSASPSPPQDPAAAASAAATSESAAAAAASASWASAAASVSAAAASQSAALAQIENQALAKTYTVGHYAVVVSAPEFTDLDGVGAQTYFTARVTDESSNTLETTQAGIVITLLNPDGSLDVSGKLCVTTSGNAYQDLNTSVDGGNAGWTTIKLAVTPAC